MNSDSSNTDNNNNELSSDSSSHVDNPESIVIENGNFKSIQYVDGETRQFKRSTATNAWLYQPSEDQLKKRNVILEEEEFLNEEEKWSSILDQAETLRNSKDFQQAIELLQTTAFNAKIEALRGEAYFMLGEMYEWGQSGLNQSFDKSLEFYRKSANEGFADAHAAIAFFHAIGAGVERDELLALVHYEVAALGDSIAAHMALGYRNFYGRGVEKNCDKAAFHYNIAANRVLEEVVSTGLHPLGRAIRLDENAINNDDNQRHGDEHEVLEYYQYSSDRSDASAMITLGMLYLQGSGTVPRDFARALKYFSDANQLGSASGKAMLGYLYNYGYGVEKNHDKAVELWEESLELDKDNIYAQTFYGQAAARRGHYALAYKYLKPAATRGAPTAQIELGHLYNKGLGVTRSYATALHMYSQAGKLGFVEALYHMAQLNLEGKGASQSCQTGVELLKRISERGLRKEVLMPAHECFENNDLFCAIYGYELASEYGYEVAQSNVAYLYLQNKTSQHAQQRAMIRLQDAAQQNSAVAHRRLADLHYNNALYIENNDELLKKAVALYSAASDRRDAEATFSLAYLHHHGIGVDPDPFLAKRYYDLSVQIEPAATPAATLALITLGFFLAHFLIFFCF